MCGTIIILIVLHRETTLAVLSASNLEVKQWVSVGTAVC